MMGYNVSSFMRLNVGIGSYENYKYQFKELTQEDIEKMYKINSTFWAHRDRLLSFLFFFKVLRG